MHDVEDARTKAAEIPGYYKPRTDILGYFSRLYPKVLDLGCGIGLNGELLVKHHRAQTVLGVDIDPSNRDEALSRIDAFESFDLDDTSLLQSKLPQADLILCLDVLEHLKDPWGVLKALCDKLNPDGEMLISIPNIRHLTVLIPLIFKGRWQYQEIGILDRTHLRFFTKYSMEELIQDAELEIVRSGTLGIPKRGKSYWLDLFTLGLFKEFLASQYVFLVRKKTSTIEKATLH